MHKELANRDFAIVKLQNVVGGLCAEKEAVEENLGRVVGVRNGLLYAYLELQKSYQLRFSGFIQEGKGFCVMESGLRRAGKYDHGSSQGIPINCTSREQRNFQLTIL